MDVHAEPAVGGMEDDGGLELELDEILERGLVRPLVNLRPPLGALHVPAAVAGGVRPDRERAQVAADPEGAHLDVLQRELLGTREVEEDAAEGVILVVLRVRGEALVLEVLLELALMRDGEGGAERA